MLAMTAAVTLTGCVSAGSHRYAADEAPVVTGSRVRANVTPLEEAFPCMAQYIGARNKILHKAPLSIAVGDVKDYTGRYSQAEGSTITQGGALMVYSALGKFGGTVQLAERFDTRIAELELAYMDRRQLGDGSRHVVADDNGQQAVPWLPYYGGSILQSDYYIIGGITELNYNIQSGGFEFAISNSGVKARTYTMNVGIDLRIVDTRTLRVVKTVSLEKQITGYEVGADTFRFFGNRLFDVNMGAKNQEPLQLGVRTVLEEGVLELVGAVTDVSPARCLWNARYTKAQREAALRKAEQEKAKGCQCADDRKQVPKAAGTAAPQKTVAAPVPPATPSAAVNAPGGSQGLSPQNGQGGAAGVSYKIPFDFGNPSLGGSAKPIIERLAGEAAQGGAIAIEIIARDTENWAPQKRQDITDARIRAVVDALVDRGIQRSRITTTWKPGLSDTGVRHDGPGYQIFATLAISKP
jgi:curli biogenesis system outer membrane secretion channel CsgG